MRPASASGWRRLAWFGGIYVAAVAAFALAVYGLRGITPH